MLNINDHNINLLNLVDIENILEQLLVQIRTLTSSEGGTIYLKDEKDLKFCVFQNDSLSSNKLEQIIEDTKFLRLPLSERKYIAVESFQSLKIIRINNIYEEKSLDVSGIKSFDSKFDYKTHSMLTIPLIDSSTKKSIGVLQVINKSKNGVFSFYDDLDVEFIKIASNFIGYTISKTIEYKESLEKMDQLINDMINCEIDNKIEKDRLNSFHNKILHTGKVLKEIAHRWRQPLCELSVNNSYLSSKLENKEVSELLIDNQSIIQSLSSIISDYETAYEDQKDVAFKVRDSFKISYKLINSYIKSHHIKIVNNIDKNVMIRGEKNIFIQIILSVLQNSIDAFKIKRIPKPLIEVNVREANNRVIITVEDNAGGIDEILMKSIFEVIKNDKSKTNNMTLNMLKIVLREKFYGEISAKNTKSGFMIRIEINTNRALLGVENG